MPDTSDKTPAMKTARTFLRVGTCSETLYNVLNRAYEHPAKAEEQACAPMAGGIMQNGYQCGQIWGAALAAGAESYRRFGTGPLAETKAIMAAQRIVASFRALNKEINCLELTELDKSSTTMQMIAFFLLKGGVVHCIRMAKRFAPVAYREINAALSTEPDSVPAAPVSCAAMVARKMGASEEHAVTAAGLAGGIGLCGGACGAMAAAIWIKTLERYASGADKVEYKNPEALELINRFLKTSNYEFECSKIVGRQFESVGDHAKHLCDGGCARIIEELSK